MKKILLYIFVILSYFPTILYANDSSILKSYNNFIIKLESKFNNEEQLKVLENINIKITQLLRNKNISNKSIIQLKELSTINSKKISDLKKQISDYSINDWYQIELENKEIDKFKEYKIPTIPNYVLDIINSKSRVYLNVIYDKNNWNFEFLFQNQIKRIIFNSYYKINSLNWSQLKQKEWYIFYYNWDYIFVDSYEIEEKTRYSDSYAIFKWVISSNNYFLKNWNYYYYKYDKYVYINDSYWFYIKNLTSIWINPRDLILLKNWKSYYFIKEYSEEKLIKYDLIKYINDKNKFLSYLYDDKKNISVETDNYFNLLKNVSEKLTDWLSKEEKIKTIYNYILDNITYTNPIDLSKKEIFSWIYTFKNKDWVCEWYVKLMAYMLMFSWIEDIEVIRWFVINAPDFPKVWHAWLKIGNYYYDPTFDDPIWATQTKLFNEYTYYKLPWDLFYTNRYDLNSIPDEIKSKSFEELELLVNKNLYKLVSKYKNNWYNILKYSILLYDNWLNYNEKINYNTLKNLINSIEVNWSDLSYIIDWEKKYIKKLMYYKLEENSIDSILKAINYDISNKYIIKWNFTDWTWEYRLAYQFETY